MEPDGSFRFSFDRHQTRDLADKFPDLAAVMDNGLFQFLQLQSEFPVREDHFPEP